MIYELEKQYYNQVVSLLKSDNEWQQWAEYYEEAGKSDVRLLQESIYTYVKANNPNKVKKLIAICPNKKRWKSI